MGFEMDTVTGWDIEFAPERREYFLLCTGIKQLMDI